MKRITALVLAFALVLTLAACSDNTANNPPAETSTATPSPSGTDTYTPPPSSDDTTPQDGEESPPPSEPSDEPPFYFNPDAERGNSTGNIANGGYAAIKDGKIYYMNIWGGFGSNPDAEGLHSINDDGSNRQKLSDDNVKYINVIGDRIYYSNISDGNAIYSINTDGSDCQKLSEDSAAFISVIGDRIFYSNQSDGSKIYTMLTDGSERLKLNDDHSVCVNVAGDRIYYISALDNIGIVSIRFDGSDRKTLKGSQSDYINVIGDWIFYGSYIGSGYKLCAMRTDGSDGQVIDDYNWVQAVGSNEEQVFCCVKSPKESSAWIKAIYIPPQDDGSWGNRTLRGEGGATSINVLGDRIFCFVASGPLRGRYSTMLTDGSGRGNVSGFGAN